MWDNLTTYSPGDIYIDTSIVVETVRGVKIRWAGNIDSNDEPVNFSVTLFEDGSFQFDYGSGNTGLDPTVGVSAGNGEVFVLSTYNGLAALTNAYSLKWTADARLTYFDIGAFEFQGNSGDADPPTVTSVTNLPPQSQIYPGDETAFAFSSVQIQFSEALDVISARSVANYALVEAGPDEVFATGDEITFDVLPAYSYGTDQVTLDFNAGILPDGYYRLTLSGTGTIYDTAGNALGGGMDYVHYFEIDRFSNLWPVADDPVVSVDEDASTVITLSAEDGDEDDLFYSIEQAPLHGVLTDFQPGVLPDTYEVTYTPDADYHGPDSFTFHVHDGKLGEDDGTVSITVDPVNDIPVAATQSITMPENTSRLIVLQASDLETSVVDLTFAIATGPIHGSLVQESANTWRYTPDTDYVGDDSFTFTATDQGDPDGTPGNAETSARLSSILR